MEWFTDAVESTSNWLGGAAPTSDAATASPGDAAAAAGNEPESLWGQVGQTLGDLGRGISQEGIGGLLDPSGMLDRQDAQRDLSNRFQVVGDDFEGERNHNQVSQEEYEDIARTYSNIRMGRGDLTIDTGDMDEDDATEYRDGMMNSVADMMMTTSGRSQVMGISNNVLVDDDGNARLDDDGNEIHRHTTMQPYLNDDGTLKNNNAGVGRSGSNANSEAFRQYDDDGNAAERGMGTDANLFINPVLSVGDCDRTDVILAHEMQHVQNRTQGTMLAGTHNANDEMPGDQGTNRRERQAVGLPNNGHYPGDSDGCTENTYRQERNEINPEERLAPRTTYAGRLPGTSDTVAENEEAWRAYSEQNPNAQ